MKRIKNSENVKKFMKYFPFLFLFVAFLFKAIFWDIYRIQFSEDGVIEYVQFFFYLISGLFLFVTFVQFLVRREYLFSLIFFVLCIGVLFVAAEEISWGQRIFELDTPSKLQEKNVQGELTFHNVDFFHKYILHNAYILIAIVGLILSEKPRFLYKSFPEKFINFVAPPSILKYYFFSLGVFYIFLQYIYPLEEKVSGQGNQIVYPGDQEVFEFLLAMAALAYSYSKFKLSASLRKSL